MLNEEQIEQMQKRMTLAAQVCKAMVATGRNQFFDRETYPIIYEAFAYLEEDIAAIFTEARILREAMADRVTKWSSDDGANNPRPVDQVADGESVGGSEDGGEDSEGVSAGVQTSGPNRRGGKRPKRRRNTKKG